MLHPQACHETTPLKAIHGGKTKNDKIDSFKIAALLRGGNFPLAHTYPAPMRATRDLLRRRMYLSRRCGELVAHIQNTNTQYSLPEFAKKISRKYNREGVAERFENPGRAQKRRGGLGHDRRPQPDPPAVGMVH